MASSNDVRDILGLDRGATSLNFETPLNKVKLMGQQQENKRRSGQGQSHQGMKRPEGMARELYNLLYNDR